MFGNERPERQKGNEAVRESETRKGQVSRAECGQLCPWVLRAMLRRGLR